MSGIFFRGTSADQDTRFSNKNAKLMKTHKFPPELDEPVDMTKVQMDVIKPWIARRVTDFLGIEDEVVIDYIFGMLEGKKLDGKNIQIQITGFLEKNSSRFMKELWILLLSAQKNPSGIPQQFLDDEAEKQAKKQAAEAFLNAEFQKARDAEAANAKESKEAIKDLEAKQAEARAAAARINAQLKANNGTGGAGPAAPPVSDENTEAMKPVVTRSRSQSRSRSRSRSLTRSPSRSPSPAPWKSRRSVSPRKRGRSRTPPRRRWSASRSYSRSPPRRTSPPRRSPYRYNRRSPPVSRAPERGGGGYYNGRASAYDGRRDRDNDYRRDRVNDRRYGSRAYDERRDRRDEYVERRAVDNRDTRGRGVGEKRPYREVEERVPSLDRRKGHPLEGDSPEKRLLRATSRPKYESDEEPAKLVRPVSKWDYDDDDKGAVKIDPALSSGRAGRKSEDRAIGRAKEHTDEDEEGAHEGTEVGLRASDRKPSGTSAMKDDDSEETGRGRKKCEEGRKLPGNARAAIESPARAMDDSDDEDREDLGRAKRKEQWQEIKDAKGVGKGERGAEDDPALDDEEARRIRKEDRRARKEARRKKREEKRLRKEAKRARKEAKKQKVGGRSIDGKEQAEARSAASESDDDFSGDDEVPKSRQKELEESLRKKVLDSLAAKKTPT